MAAGDDRGDAVFVGGIDFVGCFALDGLAGAIGAGFAGTESAALEGEFIQPGVVYRVLLHGDSIYVGFECGAASGDGAGLGLNLGGASAMDVAQHPELCGGAFGGGGRFYFGLAELARAKQSVGGRSVWVGGEFVVDELWKAMPRAEQMAAAAGGFSVHILARGCDFAAGGDHGNADEGRSAENKFGPDPDLLRSGERRRRFHSLE